MSARVFLESSPGLTVCVLGSVADSDVGLGSFYLPL
jgi:hypothetical protein